MTCSNLFHYYRCPRYDKRGYNILRFLIRGKWCIIDFNTFNALNWSDQIFNMYVQAWDDIANLWNLLKNKVLYVEMTVLQVNTFFPGEQVQ